MILSSFLFVLLAATNNATPLSSGKAITARHINTACAEVSKTQSAQLAANTSVAIVDAQLAAKCLASIPLVQQDATDLLLSLKSYIEFQSDLEYLKTPPTGYVNPSFDLEGAFNQIASNVKSGSYQSEIDFQTDLYYALSATFNGHTYFKSDILYGIFSFGLFRFRGLASVSKDGIEAPKLYFVDDLFLYSRKDEVFHLLNNSKISPVVKIDGRDASEAVEIMALASQSTDADARYNSELFSIAGPQSPAGALLMTVTPPTKSSMTFQFANGSSIDIAWEAIVNVDFTNVTTGADAYSAFAPFANVSALESATPTTSSAPTSSTTSTTLTSSTAIPYFPPAVIKDTDNVVAGYYLDQKGYEDIAVLQIISFEVTEDLEEFSGVVAQFLRNATADGKKKLVIDLQQNGGGFIDLGTDLYVQLFPNHYPDTSSNMRRSAGMDIIIESAAAEVQSLASNATAQDEEAFANSPWAYQYSTTPRNVNIRSTQELLNGIKYNGQDFTAFFQTNYSDPLASQVTGFSITQTNTKAQPPFAPENIIILTDGICASTCTTFSEHMKNQAGVQFIVIGGRPQTGPVQAVGGVKGSQVFDFNAFTTMLGIYYNATEAQLAAVNNTIWDDFDILPLARTAAAAAALDPSAGVVGGGVNGRNAFRLGDTTNTPLYYVYEAADCRLWWTPELAIDPVKLWQRVADVAFKNRSGLKYNSPYCVAGSTGHPTSISGGWKKGTLGPQDQGKIEASSPIFMSLPWLDVSRSKLTFDWSQVDTAEKFGSTCGAYAGKNWAVKMLCTLYNKGS